MEKEAERAESSRVLNITIQKNGIVEYGDVSQLQDMFVNYHDQKERQPNKDPFGAASASLVAEKAVLPHYFQPSICTVVNNEAGLRKFLANTEKSKTASGATSPKSPTSPKAWAERAKYDPPKWSQLDQVGNENDNFNPDVYKYKMPNLFEFYTKEVIDNHRLKELIFEAKGPSKGKQ